MIKKPEQIIEKEPNSGHFRSNLGQAPWLLIILGVVMSSAIMINNSYAAVLLKEEGISLDYLGFILFLFNLGMALGSHLRLKWEMTLLFPLFMLLLSFQSFAFLTILCQFIMRVLNANYINHFSLKFNKKIKENRAIYWSIYNFCTSLTFTLSDLAAGFIADHWGLLFLYRFFALLASAILVFYFLIRKFQNEH